MFYQSNPMVYKLNYSSNNRIMDCCCRPQQSIIHEDERPTMGLPKMKFSFRTQQASPNTKFTSTTLYQTTPSRGNYDVKNDKFALGSTVASNDELYQLQKQREYLIQEDRNLDMFYNNAIVPLERQLEYYERQVKVRSIEIMELQQLLAIRMRQRNMMHNTVPFQNINPVQIQPWQPLSMPMHQHIPVNLAPQNISFVPINTVNQTLSGFNVVPATVRPRQVVQN